MTRPIPSASPSIEAETAYAHIARSSTKWATGPSFFHKSMTGTDWHTVVFVGTYAIAALILVMR